MRTQEDGRSASSPVVRKITHIPIEEVESSDTESKKDGKQRPTRKTTPRDHKSMPGPYMRAPRTISGARYKRAQTCFFLEVFVLAHLFVWFTIWSSIYEGWALEFFVGAFNFGSTKVAKLWIKHNLPATYLGFTHKNKKEKKRKQTRQCNVLGLTSILLGLISRWTTLFRCRYARACKTCKTQSYVSFLVRPGQTWPNRLIQQDENSQLALFTIWAIWWQDRSFLR